MAAAAASLNERNEPVDVDWARSVLRSAADADRTAAHDEARRAGASALEQTRGAREAHDEARAAMDKSLPLSDDLDAKWKEFQRKFDLLMESSVKAIAGALGAAVPGAGGCKLRPAESIDELRAAQVLRRASRVVVLTGAGVSAESGIPTFRGADGFWTVGSKNYQPQELATWEKFNEMPAELWRWYQYRWGICRNALPNAGHKALVEMEGLLPGGLDLVTQNIDGLHRIAGSNESRLFEVHGRIDMMRCDERLEGACLYELDLNDVSNFEVARATVVPTPKPAKREEDEALPRCAKCCTRQRPKILWFDECYNEAFYRSKSALEAAERCDALLIIGTQLTTGLPRRIVAAAQKTGATIIKMDPLVDVEDESSAGMLHLQGKSGEVLPRILAHLRKLLTEPSLAPLADPPEAPQVAPGGKLRSASKQGAPLAARPAAPAAAAAPAAPAAARAKARSASQASLRTPSKTTSAAASGGALRASAKAALLSSSSSSSSGAPGGGAARRQPSAPPGGGRRAEGAAGAAAAAAASAAAAAAVGGPEGFFVYGTLRPDDDSGASWTKDFCQGLAAEPAKLRGASLYVNGSYPAVCFEKTLCEVRGVFLSAPQPGLLEEKLSQADRIEGYPDLFERAVARVATRSGPERLAYVYHRTGRLDRATHVRVSDGDWLSRPRDPAA